jgi:hypothetical protein
LNITTNRRVFKSTRESNVLPILHGLG